MTERELQKIKTLQLLDSGRLTREEAAKYLELSVRQIDRIKRRLRLEGLMGLAHKNRGKKSNNRIKKEFRKEVVNLVKEYYSALNLH